MDTVRINQILLDCHVGVTEAQELPPGVEVVDVFMMVPLDVEKVRGHAKEMIELLKEWPSESWGVPVPPLGEEISYRIAGAVLDSQSRAFMFFALGKLLEWWDILDPCTMLGLEKTDEAAQKLAADGFISIAGYRPEPDRPGDEAHCCALVSCSNTCLHALSLIL